MESVPNVGSYASCKSRCSSSKSSTLSFMTVKAEVKRAALLARTSTLKRKHAIAMKAGLLHKRPKEMQIEMDIETSDADLAVYKHLHNKMEWNLTLKKTKEKTVSPVKPASSMSPAVRRDVSIHACI